MKREKGSEKEALLCEAGLWKNSLENILQENSSFKTMLAKVLDENNSKAFLALAEDFQNSFISKDELLKELLGDVSAQNALVNKRYILNDVTLIKHQKLRNEINHFEKNFANLRLVFTQFLANHLQN
ncbi:MAG: hypothetical protein ABIW38_10185 [Ferruginibacter sp.]